MKKILFPIVTLFVFACSNAQHNETKLEYSSEKKSIDSTIKKETQNKIQEVKFIGLNGQAILIGKNIALLNEDLTTREDISNLNGKIVDLVSVTDSFFNNSKDLCDAWWYVKIKSENKAGIVNGRQVFKIQHSKQDTSFTMDGNEIEILTTKFLGMGVEYQGDLMGCPEDQPVLIRDKKNNYFGLVNLIPNKYSKEASFRHEYPFFELKDDDGAKDMITSIAIEGTKFKLKIHRHFQEGENDFEVLIKFDHNKYIAEYLNYGEVKYE